MGSSTEGHLAAKRCVPLRHRKACLAALTAVALLLGLGLSLFGSGARYGMYTDDYSYKLWAFDPERGRWTPRLDLEQPHFRPFGQILTFNLANALPNHEAPVRVLWAVVHLCNVLLTGFLVFRLVRSPLAAVLAGGLLLVPVQAHEAVFWHSAAAQVLLGTLVILVAMHLFLGALGAGRTWWRHALLALLAVGLAPFFYEQASVGILVLPLLSEFERPASKRRRIRALSLLLIAVGLLILYWSLVLRHAYSITSRGGLQPSLGSLILEGLPKTFEGVKWALWFAYGIGGFAAAARLGAQAIWNSPWAVVCVALLAITSTLAIASRAAEEQRASSSRRQLLLLLAVGCVWFAAAFIPVALVKGQGVSSRLLYFPWVGLSFALSAIATLVLRGLPARWRWVPCAGLGGALVAGVVLVAGFGRVYQLRYAHDQAQLAALVDAVPSLPLGNVEIVVADSEERFVPGVSPGSQALDSVLAGVFETSWSTRAAISMEYRKRDVLAVNRSRWRELVLQAVSHKDGDVMLEFPDLSVRASQCLAFSFRDGKVVLHDSVTVELPDLTRVEIELPLARQVAAPGAVFEEMALTVSEK